jgi:hypothetical protein
MIFTNWHLRLGVACIALMSLGCGGSAGNPSRGQKESGILLTGGSDLQAYGDHVLLLATAELYHERSGEFTATGPMNFGRIGHTATRLMSGKVLITGGDSNATDDPFDSAELYNPATGTFIVTGSMTVARVAHTATLLRNGEVLVAGGADSISTATGSAELYDPASGSFSATGSMTVPRLAHSATLLPNGTVLIVGGYNYNGICPPDCALSSAEIYDPSTGNFTATGSMFVQHQSHIAVLLDDGQVLIAGGGSTVDGCSGCSTADAELYDPPTGQFIDTGPMNTSRRGFTATWLTDGKVLIAGGINDSPLGGTSFLNSAELYDPRSGSFGLTGSMMQVRFGHSATLLDDGQVLVAGGFYTRINATNTAELFDPTSDTFGGTGIMTDAREEQTATSLASH